MEIVIIVLVILAAVIIIGWPLVNARRYRMAGDGVWGVDPFEDLYNERDRALDALRDLQVEHTTGQISDADYALYKSRYDMKAAMALQQLDALEANQNKKTARKGASAQKTKACPRCHAHIESDDQFCFECGYKL